MALFDYDGMQNLLRDAPGQIEYNRKKNLEQDVQINTINSKISELISQAPSGFLPKVYYGLTQGAQTYRFIPNAVLGVTGLIGNIGDAFEILNTSETSLYISAIGIKTDEDQLTIAIQGDYNLNTSSFTIVNMVSGSTMNVSWTSPLALQDASYLGSYNANDNQGKQITVLYNLETNEENVIYASVDFNNDGVYNWVRIGGYQNGINGQSIFGVVSATASTVFGIAQIGDVVLAGEDFIYSGITFQIGDLFSITSLSPLSVQSEGNIRGAKGDTGDIGATGAPGQNGYTPYIQDGNWYINGVDTGVQAMGQNGTNGTNGQSFQMNSGLYSTDDNYGQAGNVGPNAEVLLQLPTLPQASGMTGYAYVVFDPLTTPLEPFYDLYYANDNDNDWTIIHPFSGLKGADGTNGYTPYIYNNEWYINGVNTGIQATGDTGPQGPMGKSIWTTTTAVSDTENDIPDAVIGDYIMNTGSSALSILGETANIGDLVEIITTTTGSIAGNIRGPKGDTGNTGATGATPVITGVATVDNNTGTPSVSVVKTGTDSAPTLTFNFSNLKGATGSTGATGPGVPSGGTTGQYLAKNSNTDYDTKWESIDATPTNGSTKAVQSTGVYSALTTAKTNTNSLSMCPSGSYVTIGTFSTAATEEFYTATANGYVNVDFSASGSPFVRLSNSSNSFQSAGNCTGHNALFLPVKKGQIISFNKSGALTNLYSARLYTSEEV